jgi:NAD(P)-dependent dehydrogenase (short-subunit alcohol dehydrogenase family)
MPRYERMTSSRDEGAGMRLQDQVAIITGAASGIGAGTAEVFAEQGARLVLVDRDGDRLEATAMEVEQPKGREVENVQQPSSARHLDSSTPRLVTYAGDVSDPETARGAERLARETFGGVDILFNNAGVMTSGDFREVDEAAWDDVLDINLRGMYLMCRAVLPGMLERGHGAIVNTSSVMALLTEPGYEAYTTSKAGIIGLTKALAVSYATQGIRVNCICPGWVDTPMNQRLAEELGGMEHLTPIILRQQPNGRMLSTREIGNAVAFLASDEASGITGAALYVDGGASAAI